MWELVLRSVWISGTAVAMACSWSFPLTLYLVKRRSRLISVFESLVGVPTVLVGLLLYELLCSKCPLGWTGLLYTPQAIMIGEALLVTPVLVATSYFALKDAWERYGELALSLGATEREALLFALEERGDALAGSIIMAFSRAIGELGVALIVGGNIAGYTRTITTAIALYTSMGEFEKALYLGLVLTFLSVVLGAAVRSKVRVEG